ncbi:MAG: class I SAM-dependent methyltransferase [Solirubrobacteraceae bacterium]
MSFSTRMWSERARVASYRPGGGTRRSPVIIGRATTESILPQVERAWHALQVRLPFLRAAIDRRRAGEYEAAVARALDDTAARTALVAGSTLPEGWGAGRSERLVEFPWAVAKLAEREAGLTLDAGSTLNHPYVLDQVLALVDALHVVTLAPEKRSFPERGISYVYADLRDLPVRSSLYDTVVCISTLEHVGMDVSGYKASVAREADPQRAAVLAAGELRRVVKPTGRILLSVPFGRPDNLGWLRQFDPPALRGLIDGFGPAEVDKKIYRHTEHGWQLSSEEAAADCASQPYWAQAVACVEIRPREVRAA